MAFKFVGLDPTNGCERWSDPTTGAVELRNCPSAAEIKTEVSQATPAADPTKATLTQAELNSITEGSPVFTQNQINKDLTAGKAPNKPGTTTNDDASINNTKSGTNTTFNAATNPSNPIKPSPNVLDQFASYTYSLSWYLLTPQQANVMSNTSKINTNQWSLLAQSGGAPPVVPTASPSPPQTANGLAGATNDQSNPTSRNSLGI